MTVGEMLQLTNRMKNILNDPADQIKPRLDVFLQDLTHLMDVIKDPTLNQLYCTVCEERFERR